MIYLHQLFEASYEVSSDAAYSPALLAFKRFIRRILRPLAIASISCLLLLYLSAHASAHISAHASAEAKSQMTSDRASNQTSDRAVNIAIPPLSKSFYGPRSELSYSHLTSARLAIPQR
ncbi:MAG: hypothetical protein DCF15_18770 [Phormidesmis priestleyi]|uniref:Uncharacterized protein n=1 Tax=Phormidesmis priestleyi TaxID=268141 RepID=A0A2W4WR50_9CYAN|nr:MAG: hypothetical protein DCF15_18770 [Phormidesmis priestleyi]